MRRVRSSITLSTTSSSFGVRSPVSAEMCTMGAKSRNFRLKRSLSSNSFEKSCPSPFHQVPLVDGDDDAAPRALGFAGNRAVLIGRAKRRVDHQHDEVGVGNRAPRQTAR